MANAESLMNETVDKINKAPRRKAIRTVAVTGGHLMVLMDNDECLVLSHSEIMSLAEASVLVRAERGIGSPNATAAEKIVPVPTDFN